MYYTDDDDECSTAITDFTADEAAGCDRAAAVKEVPPSASEVAFPVDTDCPSPSASTAASGSKGAAVQFALGDDFGDDMDDFDESELADLFVLEDPASTMFLPGTRFSLHNYSSEEAGLSVCF